MSSLLAFVAGLFVGWLLGMLLMGFLLGSRRSKTNLARKPPSRRYPDFEPDWPGSELFPWHHPGTSPALQNGRVTNGPAPFDPLSKGLAGPE